MTASRKPYVLIVLDGFGHSDNPDSSMSDGKDVWDLHSASKAVASDGTTYDTW